MDTDLKEQTEERFKDFFKDSGEIGLYPNGSVIESIGLSGRVSREFVKVRQMLLNDFNNNEFGQKCLKMMQKYNCTFNFSPEKSLMNDGGRSLKGNVTKGELIARPDGFEMNIYSGDPVSARSCMDHESAHMVQYIKMGKAFGIGFKDRLNFKKFMVANLVLEADAFARQAELAYENKDRPEIFNKMKEEDVITKVYADTINETGDRNAAYTKAFDMFFTSRRKEEAYSTFYATQYMENNGYKRDHKDFNIAKMVQIISEKRHKTPDKVENLAVENFRFKAEDMLEINHIYASAFSMNDERCDTSYQEFRVIKANRDLEMDRISEIVEGFSKYREADENSKVGVARKNLLKTMAVYREKDIPITGKGKYFKDLTKWIDTESEIVAKEMYASRWKGDLIEAKRLAETIDKRKPKRTSCVEKAEIQFERMKAAKYLPEISENYAKKYKVATAIKR